MRYSIKWPAPVVAALVMAALFAQVVNPFDGW